MVEVRRQIREAVETGCEMVLITGETGTGKDVTAREIHFQAAAADDPFVTVSCPAFADSLLESELFGHVKGAFTGATEDRAGCFELADGGTIFLDEAGDLSLSAQAKILRVLETRSLRRVGGSEEIAVTVRAIAATNAPLEQLVQSGRFRRDLFYRLNAYSIHLLPLRQRREDILPLAEHFLAGYASAKGFSLQGFDADASAKLLEYDFPGNARELRYLVQRAAILCRSGRIRAEHLTLPAGTEPVPSAVSNDEQERTLLLSALETARWNCRRAAQRLGLPYSTLRYKMCRLGIRK
jgi:transcriptional regulator with GAF, ATPase, and Fis domain